MIILGITLVLGSLVGLVWALLGENLNNGYAIVRRAYKRAGYSFLIAMFGIVCIALGMALRK